MINDIRYAFRALRQNPGFALAAIVSIGLAIGANSSIFSFIDGIILRPLPVPRPAQVVTLRTVEPVANTSAFVNLSGGVSYSDFADFRDTNTSFDGLMAFNMTPTGFAKDSKTQPQLQMAYLVTANFFSLLGVKLQVGRDFSPDDDRVPGRDSVLVVSYDFWKSEFSGDPLVIGRSVRVSGLDFTIIGVAPETFPGLDQFISPSFYIPSMMAQSVLPNENILTDRADRRFQVKGRLKPGVSIATAAREASALAKALDETYPATNRGFGATVQTENQIRFDRLPVYRAVVPSLFGLVAIVLLIACTNVANLMLSRGRARAREIAIRLAIGAGRRRLIRQLMVESSVIALAGGAFGLLLAGSAVQFFSAMVRTTISDAPVRLNFQLDNRVLLFTLLVSGVSALLFGLGPAFQSTKANLNSTLKSGEFSDPRKRFLGRNTLATVQIAGSVLLVIAAAQLYRGYAFLLGEAHGFRRDHVLTMRLDPSVAGYNPTQTAQFYKTLSERSLNIPEIQSVGLTSFLPLTTDIQQKTVIPEGYPLPTGQQSLNVFSSSVDEHYFQTFGVPILEGRAFLPTDTSDSPKVAIVNLVFAQKYFQGKPIGKRIRLNGPDGPFAEIVGMAVTGQYLSVSEPLTDFLFLPHSQAPRARMTFLTVSTGDPGRVAGTLRQLVRSMDPNLPILAVRTMDDVFQQSAVSNFRLTTMIFGSAGMIGFGLALVGLYAVVAYQVARRTREIGIRMALGADQPRVLRLVLWEAAVMSIVGVAVGLALSLAAGRGLTMGRPIPFRFTLNVLVPAALLLTTLLAAAIPARRASRVDPLVALRQD